MSRKFMTGMALVLTLTLWGCTIHVTTEVSPEGSGRYVVELGVTEEDRELMQSFDLGSPPEGEFCSEFFEVDARELSIRQERRGEEIRCVAEQTFQELDELRRLYESEGIQVNELRIEDGRFSYEIVMEMSDQATGLEEAQGFLPEVEWRVQVPGSVRDTNADRVEGRTLIWVLEPGQTDTLRAETNVGGSVPWLWIGAGAAACVLGLLGLGLVGGLLWLGQRRKEAPAT
ncbi:MAG: hypothetical protein R3191_01970 [Anaerolineales bacterium]|nr:hypothetical protein [Anaerolineales bacterium]